MFGSEAGRGGGADKVVDRGVGAEGKKEGGSRAEMELLCEVGSVFSILLLSFS